MSSTVELNPEHYLMLNSHMRLVATLRKAQPRQWERDSPWAPIPRIRKLSSQSKAPEPSRAPLRGLFTQVSSTKLKTKRVAPSSCPNRHLSALKSRGSRSLINQLGGERAQIASPAASTLCAQKQRSIGTRGAGRKSTHSNKITLHQIQETLSLWRECSGTTGLKSGIN